MSQPLLAQESCRVVARSDAQIASPTRLSFDILETLAERITTEVPGVVSVTYNVTRKPPSTIEAV